MIKRIIILLLITSVACGYFEISNDVPTVFSDSADQQWRMWSGHNKADELFNDSPGILFDVFNFAVVIGNFTPGSAPELFTSVGMGAGVNAIGDDVSLFGVNAGVANRSAGVTIVGSQSGIYNTGTLLSALGFESGRFNDGTENTALGVRSFNNFTLDTGAAIDVFTVDFANNQVVTAGAHGLGIDGLYLNLKATTTGTLPAGLGAGPDIWQVIDFQTLECFTDSFTDAGTGTHTLTPQFVYTNSTAVGFDSEPDASNQIMLGDTNVTEVKTSGGLSLGGTLDMNDNPIIDVGYIDFDLVNGVVPAEGRLVWNPTDKTLDLGMAGGSVNQQIGLEQLIRGKNASGTGTTDGRPVRISGASGSNPEFSFSEADVPASAGSIGLFTEDIATNSNGYVTTFGMVRDIDTSGPGAETWAEGDRIYVGNTSGALTNVVPTSDERVIFIGIVLRAHATEGVILVHTINVSYLRELSGNQFTTEVEHNIIQYNGTVWENRADLTINGDTTLGKNIIHTPSAVQNITAAGGITVTNAHMRIEGDGGPIDITANPQIAAGTDGQVLMLEGHSNTNTVKIDQGDGVHMYGGNIVLGLHDVISFQYDADSLEWQEISSNSQSSEKSWAFMSRDAGSGTSYVGGFYQFHSGTSTFVAPATFGTANLSYAAHVFIVCDSSPASDSVIRVSGTSITDGGVRTAADTEDLTFLSTASANDYKETPKKWLGQVTFTFISGDNTVLYNRGFCKYWDNNNTNYQVIGFEATWLGAKNDNNPDIKIRHHRPTGWTFTGTTPTPPAEIASMAADHNTEIQIGLDQEGAWKRDNLFENVDGSNDEGIIIELITTTNRTYAIGNFMVRVRPK